MNKEFLKFQNQGWQKGQKELDFKHKAADNLIEKGLILDLGCGDGIFLEHLKKRGINGIGLDISERAVELAKSRGLDCRVFDLGEKLPFEDNSFETVILIDTLEHLFMPQEILREVHRVTKSHLILSTPNFVSLAARIQVLRGLVPENNTLRKAHVVWVTRKLLHRLLREANFKIEKEIFDSFYLGKPILGRIFEFLAGIRPEIFALSFIIRAKKIHGREN
jgi:methionine biosynthesis protein MetW